MNNTKITFLLLILTLVGCHPKSEIDKCVDAHFIGICNSPSYDVKGRKTYEAHNETEEDCVESFKKYGEFPIRIQCLRAQSGKP